MELPFLICKISGTYNYKPHTDTHTYIYDNVSYKCYSLCERIGIHFHYKIPLILKITDNHGTQYNKLCRIKQSLKKFILWKYPLNTTDRIKFWKLRLHGFKWNFPLYLSHLWYKCDHKYNCVKRKPRDKYIFYHVSHNCTGKRNCKFIISVFWNMLKNILKAA